MTTKKRITKHEHAMVLGLMLLARKYTRMADEASNALEDLLGEERKAGRVTDSIWAGSAPPEIEVVDLYKYLNIEVEP